MVKEITFNNETILEGKVPVTSEQRFERKFFVPPGKKELACTLLRQVCRPDIEYPWSQINTLYFDTPDLDQYQRSASGEFRKDKVRIRWYGGTEDSQGMVPVFLELKSRRGFASSKQRHRVLVSSELLEISRLSAGIVNKRILMDTIAGFGHCLDKPLRQVILVTYSRYRFNEVFTGMRVSFDYDIRSSTVAADIGYGEQGLLLQGAVIELKGLTLDIPPTLSQIKLVVPDWGRFSKYARCIDSHLSGPGSAGRLWPSGRTGEQ